MSKKKEKREKTKSNHTEMEFTQILPHNTTAPELDKHFDKLLSESAHNSIFDSQPHKSAE
jgi:hypothetical protein